MSESGVPSTSSSLTTVETIMKSVVPKKRKKFGRLRYYQLLEIESAPCTHP
jgi:hypothetical protein